MENVKNSFLSYIDDFETEAEEFLKNYCPDVLNSSQKKQFGISQKMRKYIALH